MKKTGTKKILYGDFHNGSLLFFMEIIQSLFLNVQKIYKNKKGKPKKYQKKIFMFI
jgi:hypothetical protein